MDNRIFNINGKGEDLLLKVLDIALIQEGYGETKIKAWKFDKEKGLILYWYAKEGTNAFPEPLNAEQLLPIVVEFLNKSADVKCDGWDKDLDHDGFNTLGWRVYCEDWGHIGHDGYAYLAVKPAYMWHGK